MRTSILPRAYVGLAASYDEQVTEDFERLTGEDWKKDLMLTPPAEVAWGADLVAHGRRSRKDAQRRIGSLGRARRGSSVARLGRAERLHVQDAERRSISPRRSGK